ncbi:MAG: DUF4328 domain-containing protein [Deltaproteobacteria bacterium]|nr:DUF4328 domain-containing protein [Nannocystaceae bacterium]
MWLRVFMIVAALNIFVDLATLEALITAPRGGLDRDAAEALDVLTSLAFLGHWFALLFAAVAVGGFLVRANRNTASFYRPVLFSPGSMVWWYFVPVLNLVRPYQCMRELWHASFPYSRRNSAPPSELGMWWALWLAGWFLGNLASDRFEEVHANDAIRLFSVDVIATACMIGAASLLRGFVVGLAALQDEAHAERIGATLPG